MLRKGFELGNRYVIIDRVGAGGMSIVYKAKCTRLSRIVAIKVLREEFVEDKEFVNKFLSEAQSVASLSHPNIISIYDVGNDGDIYYIVMEYIEGKTLKEVIQKSDKTTDKVNLIILLGIAEALSYAHKNNIVHRDLKSKNVLINEDGIVKVSDFGIAKATASSTISLTTNAIGSVHYFSPEQAKGEVVDARSDIYSFGIVMYELFTKQLPFDGESPVNVALKHVTESVPKPGSINPNIQPDVESVIIKATQKEKENRYQTAKELSYDIEAIIEGRELQKKKKKPKIVETVENVIQPVENTIKKEEKIKEKNKEKPKPLNDMYKVALEDEEDDKKEKKLVFAAIVTSFIIIAALVFAMFKYLDFISSKVIVKVPNLLGQNYEEIKDDCKKAGIILVLVGEEFDEEYAEGIIISQGIDPLESVKANSPVDVVVSKGTRLVAVPDVSNLGMEEAEARLTEYKYVVSMLTEKSDEVMEGNATRTEPAAGERLEIGSEIVLYISLGSDATDNIKVPDLKNKTVSDAEAALTDFELVLGNITYRETGEVKEGLVLAQSPEAGANLKASGKVNIEVSKKPPASNNEPGENTQNPDNNDPNEGQTVAAVNKRVVNIKPIFSLTKSTYNVQIVVQNTTGVKVAYNTTHAKEDFPFTRVVEAEPGSMIAVYIDNKLQSEDYIE